MPQIYCDTPLGVACITESDGFISKISIMDVPEGIEPDSSPILLQAVQQLDEYFAGKRQVFDFKMKQEGTPFQQEVWRALSEIGYGKTITYTQQSNRMKNPLAIRAIAAANGKNNLWIVVPCHRVIGASGELTGYAGGLWRKQWLLEHEAKVLGIGQIKMAI